MKDLPLFRFFRNLFTAKPTTKPVSTVFHRTRKPVQKRKKYRCFVFHKDSKQAAEISEKIQAHPRLAFAGYAIIDDENRGPVYHSADRADILFVCISDNELPVSTLLQNHQLAEKMVIAIPDPDSRKPVRTLKRRIDYWMPKSFTDPADSFRSLMAPVIKVLDSDITPRLRTPMKPVYRCFIWQLGFGLRELKERVTNHDRLRCTYACHEFSGSKRERSAANSADILFVSSGGNGPECLVRFLDGLDIRSKVVIVSSALLKETVYDRTPRRIDHFVSKSDIMRQETFNKFMVKVLKDLDSFPKGRGSRSR